MAFRLDNKNALITGAASGIGRTIALLFAEQGANVMAVDRNLDDAQKVAQEAADIGRKALAHHADVSDESAVRQMAERAAGEMGGIDIVVAAAALAHAHYGEGPDPRNYLVDKPLADWRRVMSINLDGVFLTNREAARVMIDQGRGGRIINIASGVAVMPQVRGGDYSVSKAGVWMLTKVFAMELAQYKITANAIAPGFIRTPMTAFLKERMMASVLKTVPLGRLGEPADIANLALFLASDEASYITGQLIHDNGGAVIP